MKLENTALTDRRSVLIGLAMICTASIAHTSKPNIYLSANREKIDLEQDIPHQFGDWVEDKSIAPVVPDPQMQAELNSLYSATLARTYRNASGRKIMLSIAYGSDQGSEATAVHRPEFCYSAQGFNVTSRGTSTVALGDKKLLTKRLIAKAGSRHEPIIYWITIGERAMLPGIARKIAQIQFGLNKEIPDGLLFRVSTLSALDQEDFSTPESFLKDLNAAINVEKRNRYFGANTA